MLLLRSIPNDTFHLLLKQNVSFLQKFFSPQLQELNPEIKTGLTELLYGFNPG